jgi:hypothetical protein
MPATYEPIATTTLGSSNTTVTFSSIPSTYTDLRVVVQYTLANGSNNQMLMRFNSDTATNYSRTYMEGSGTSATSGRGSSEDSAFITYASSNTQITTSLIDVMNYSNATTHKTALSRLSNTTLTDARVYLWRKTPEAINTITFSVYLGSSFATGSTFTLYGIKAA